MSKQPCTPNFVSCDQLAARFSSCIHVLCQHRHRPTMVTWGRANLWVGGLPSATVPRESPWDAERLFYGIKDI